MGGLLGGGGGTISNEAQMAKGLRVQSSTFGAVQTLCFGRPRVSGNLIDYIDFTAIAHTTTQTSGGKGGGGVTSSNTSYTYTVGAAIGLCAGPVVGVRRAFSDKDVRTLSELNLSAFTGELNQSPWPYMLSKHPERALNYPYLCYVAGVVNLGDSDSIPNWSFEIDAMCQFSEEIPDANCFDVINKLLTDPFVGANFPVEYMGDNSLYNAYCIANGFFISPAYTDQQEAASIINDIMMCSNSQPVPSQGKLYFKPYGTETITGNGVTYTPDLTPIFTVNDDDYIYRENEDPVKQLRDDTVDRYNFQRVEFLNRNDNYSPDVASAPDQASIDHFGLRTAQPVSLHCIADANVAQAVAENILQRGLYYHKQYEFVLPYYPFIYLDPMDLIAINDSVLGLENALVRIINCDPNDNKEITFTVEEVGIAAGSAAKYDRQAANRTSLNYNSPPGNVSDPAIFELPYILTDGKMAVMLATAGTGEFWGGCTVWVSFDDATYLSVGKIKNPNRYGVLAEKLKAGGLIDTFNTLDVDMSLSKQKLNGGTQQDAQTYQTISWVDGELISYQNATLAAENKYSLSYLVRGCYGSETKEHAQGSKFVRLDRDTIFKYEYMPKDIGRKIYIKLTSFNIFGTKEQELDEVEPYTYVIQGKIPDASIDFTISQSETKLIASLKNNYSSTDYLSFFTYELRMGPTWEKAVLVNRFNGDKYTFDAPTEGTLTFWLKAIDQAGNYSKTATRAIVNVVGLPERNIIYEYSPEQSEWQVSNMWRDINGKYQISSLKTLEDYERFSDIFGSPQYLRNDAEIILPVIDLGPNIMDESCYWIDKDGNMRLKSVETLASFERFSDIFGATLTPVKPEFAKETFASVDVKHTISGNARVDVEYRTSIDGQAWGSWIPASVKQFTGRFVQVRLLPVSVDGLGQVYISGVTIIIDVPDIEEIVSSQLLSAERTHISYKKKFGDIKQRWYVTRDLAGKAATNYVTNETLEGFDIEIWDENGNIIAGRLDYAGARGY